MSATVYAHLAWIVPVAMLVLAVILVSLAIVIDGARRDRRHARLYSEEMAWRALSRALTHDPELQRRLDKWS